ncbi:hypothetical protein MLD38_005373 [Melastoma candidum]|uniref:Uncharacterized protein n=1 Tax=Melastoma candidum TaxID=119954 RepID=A0ACB9SH76_9MYRT|nr:hypothetical protein MLD38_005373 [Melastoma candidum]
MSGYTMAMTTNATAEQHIYLPIAGKMVKHKLLSSLVDGELNRMDNCQIAVHVLHSASIHLAAVTDGVELPDSV